MNTMFSDSDKKFLRSAGIASEPTFEEERLALAQRIARHAPPAHVKLDADAAKRQLIRLSLQKLLDASREQE